MYILGLTGSIGMGKTTAAATFRRFGVPVYDADAAVHQLMTSNRKATDLVSKIFPDAVVNNNVDREVLGSIVFNDKKSLESLELILHPLVRDMQFEFLRQQGKARESLVVLDVPLLFEKKIDKLCDTVAVVTAPLFLQEIRVLKRPKMTSERFKQITENQLPNLEKIKRAEFIIQTSMGLKHSLIGIRKIINISRQRCGNCWSI